MTANDGNVLHPLLRGALTPGTKWIRERFWIQKHSDPGADLSLWGERELSSLIRLLAWRLVRGLAVRLRLGHSRGVVLAGPRVRIYHGKHISCGRLLNLEEGCEIVGLSKQGVVFGDRCTVGRFSIIRPTNVLLDEPGEGLRVGNHSNIGPFSFIGCSGYIQIGSNVMMGPGVTLLAETHNADRTDQTMKSQGVTRMHLSIGDDCWIGANSTILPGVSVGPGSIVGAGSVVTKNVAPFSVVGGSPARVIRSRQRFDSGGSPERIRNS